MDMGCCLARHAGSGRAKVEQKSQQEYQIILDTIVTSGTVLLPSGCLRPRHGKNLDEMSRKLDTGCFA